jgi:hypothetical protein
MPGVNVWAATSVRPEKVVTRLFRARQGLVTAIVVAVLVGTAGTAVVFHLMNVAGPAGS